MKKASKLFRKFLAWRLKNISNQRFLIFLSVITGITAGIAAVVIKNSVHLIQKLLHTGVTSEYENYLYFAYPVIGITIAVVLIRYVIKRRVGHGIPSVLYTISKCRGIIHRHNMFSSIISSAFTVGFGGSVGLEGPTVATGAAYGSAIGRLFHLKYKEVILLLGCACTGAMAAIFKAPIAAVVFALEVIMLDLTMASIIPLLLASVSAALTSYFFMGQDVLYPFQIEDNFILEDIPFYIMLGIIAGLVSVYFTRVYMGIHELFAKIKKWYTKLLIGGISLGILVFFFPSLYGEGYNAINSALHADFSYLFENSIFFDFRNSFSAAIGLFVLVILFKVVATSITFGSGGVGGIFAPTLFMGANLGLAFALLTNHIGMGVISENNFALVGMAGLISGVLHAPLTGIFLIADITSGYGLFMPLMITSTISYATTRYFEHNSVYTIQLARRGELITHHKDKAVLKMMNIRELIETNFKTVVPDATLGDLVKVVAKSQRNIFPVVDEDGIFKGIVILDNIRDIMFKPKLYDKIHARDLMFMPGVTISPEDSMEEVAQKFHSHNRFNIAVIEDGKYVGFVSRANVFSTYRKLIKDFSED